MFIRIVHGFLEGIDSDKAGLHTLAAKLHEIYPQANISEHTQDKFDALPYETNDPEICIGNSWGASAIFRRADKNPDKRTDLAIVLDPVPNEFNEPKQTLDKKGWRWRKNIGHVLLFRETESILKGTGIKPLNVAMFTGQRDDVHGYLNYEYGFASEYVLDWSPKSGPLGDFNAHFTILTEHKWVEQIMCSAIAKL